MVTKHWVLLFHNNWMPAPVSNPSQVFGQQLLTIKTPSPKELAKLLDFPEAAILYFKNSILNNIGKFIDKSTTHKVALGRYGSVVIESECSSLLAIYFLSLIATPQKDKEICQECGKPLSGRQSNFCSLKCKDKRFNKTPEKKIDRWINKMAYDKKISVIDSAELRSLAKDLFIEGEDEEKIRAMIKAKLKI